MDPLEAISSVDGRYHRVTDHLKKYFSERALIAYRVQVEGEYLLFLSESLGETVGKTPRRFTSKEQSLVQSLYNLSLEDAVVVKEIETKGRDTIKATNHDVKAVEYFIREKLMGTTLEDSLEWIHFGLTSEDVNNVAYTLMLRDGLEEVILPQLRQVWKVLNGLAKDYACIPILARTHGQPAIPTTFGKEFRVYASRLEKQLKFLEHLQLPAKLNGAVGNYNALQAAFPDTDWIGFTSTFIQKWNVTHQIHLEPNLYTTQIESHDGYAELFDVLRRVNIILLGFNQDMWRYISDDWLSQKPKDGEVGSSTMPHKVNPIDFENSEGNLGMANALLGHFSSKLPVSRLQRDLSDSTVERNFGVALAHCLIGYVSLCKGLGKITVNQKKVLEELQAHPEVITEAYQTILRREGVVMPYEQLKELSRGRPVTLKELHDFVDQLSISPQVKMELKGITPETYLGFAAKLAEGI